MILEVRSALPEASVPSQPVASNYEEVVPGPSGHAITLPSTSTIQSDPIDLGLHSTSHPHLHPLHQPIQPNGDIGGVGASTPPPPLPPPSSIGNNSMMIPDFSHT